MATRQSHERVSWCAGVEKRRNRSRTNTALREGEPTADTR